MSGFRMGDLVVRNEEYLTTHWCRVCEEAGQDPIGTFKVRRVVNRGTEYELTSVYGIPEGYYSYKFKAYQERLEDML